MSWDVSHHFILVK